MTKRFVNIMDATTVKTCHGCGQDIDMSEIASVKTPYRSTCNCLLSDAALASMKARGVDPCANATAEIERLRKEYAILDASWVEMHDKRSQARREEREKCADIAKRFLQTSGDAAAIRVAANIEDSIRALEDEK